MKRDSDRGPVPAGLTTDVIAVTFALVNGVFGHLWLKDS